MLKINVVTLFPNLFEEHLKNRPFSVGISKDLIQVNLVNLRNFALDKYGTVDDKPYGGGVGMVLMVEPIYKALCSIYGERFEKHKDHNREIILMTPRGNTYRQSTAIQLSKSQDITLICGRYEGINERVANLFCTKTISIGDYVLSGGELPALTIMESITRLLPGVLEKEEAAQNESFQQDDTKEYPQYTRPEEFLGEKVPEILLSGDHKKVDLWRKSKRIKD